MCLSLWLLWELSRQGLSSKRCVAARSVGPSQPVWCGVSSVPGGAGAGDPEHSSHCAWVPAVQTDISSFLCVESNSILEWIATQELFPSCVSCKTVRDFIEVGGLGSFAFPSVRSRPLSPVLKETVKKDEWNYRLS